jgi:hypothetical protein
MPRCSGSKPNGAPCERIVGASQSYCYSHDPSRAEERHRAASKAAKSKPNREIQDVKQRLSQLASDVLDAEVDKGTGAVVAQVLNVYLRALGIELKIKEQEELIQRMERLEQNIESNRKARYGAS